MSQVNHPSYDSKAPRQYIVDELRDLYNYRNLIQQLTLRDITVRYKRSFLGVLWTMLDPLLTMMVMLFVFTYLLKRNIPNFPVYLFTALIVFNFFSQVTNSSIRVFRRSGHLITKVYLPKSVFVIVSVATGLVNFFITLGILFVIALITRVPVTLNWFFLPIPTIILTIFALGASFVLAPIGVYFSDIDNIYSIVLRLVMYLSAIFYPVDILPDWLSTIVNINPLYNFIYLFRAPIYLGSPISFYRLLYTTLWAVGLFMFGLFIFTRLTDGISHRL